MRICIATHSIDKKDGGPSRSVPLLSKGLSEIGIDTTLMTVESPQMNNEIISNSLVTYITLPHKGYKLQMRNDIKENAYDILHLQNLWTPFYHWAALIARKLNIPYIMTPRGTLEPWSLSQKRLKKLLALKIYQKEDLESAACILATSEMEAFNIRNLGINSPIAIIPNGIDVHEYKCRPLDFKSNIKKQILFLSRIHQKKGIEILIDAWRNLSLKYPEWNIVIAGNGEENYISELNKRIKEANIETSISIIPPVFGKYKHQLYKESSIFILPTYSENFGMVIAEALSCGLPVITTKGTPWECLNKERIGWWIDLSIDNISRTIEEAIRMGGDALFEMGQKGSKYVNENFHYKHVALKNKMLYDWILGREDKPEFIV